MDFFLEDFSAWTPRDIVATIGACLIVMGLSNLAGVGNKKEGSNYSKTDQALGDEDESQEEPG